MITWTTSNDLGVVSEDFNTAITVVASSDGVAAVVYSLLNGDLPSGLTLSSNGAITGLAQNTTTKSIYKFTVRATTTNNGVTVISDRTFVMNVQGEHAPVITTTTKNLGNVFTGEYFNFRFKATDADLEDTVTFYISSGRIPTGLTLAANGTLSGTVAPSFGVVTRKTYNFRVAATDSKNTVFAPYQLTVLNRSANTADNSAYLASNTVVHADAGVTLIPVILNTDLDLGVHRSDDRFSYQITAFNFDNAAVTYSIASGALPPSLALHASTGWIEGYLPTTIPLGLHTYNFAVVATSSSTGLASIPKSFTISVDSAGTLGASAWTVSSNLGTMRLGDISILDINPHTDATVTFRLQAGSTLPPNLQLLSNGLIVGRISFTGVLTDHVSTNYKFTVEMYNTDGTVIATKTFNFDIDYQAPYETLYLQVFAKQSHRALYKSIIEDTELIPISSVYRFEDSNFGLTKQFKMLAITGLTPDEAAVYIANSSLNHRRKQSYIKEIKWAQARDRHSNLVYEVVYGLLKDREVNELGTSAPVVKQLGVPSRADITADNGLTNVSTGRFSNSVGSSIVVGQNAGIKSYPPSYSNMRSQIYSKMTLSSTSALPFWLSTLQPTGETLVDQNVIPLAYVKVGHAAAIVDNLNNADIDFSTIPFDIDGYVWDDYEEPVPSPTTAAFQFENGGFENGVLTNLGLTATVTGWTIYKSEVRLGGVSTILGYPTPTDSTPTPTGSHGTSLGDNASSNSMSFSVSLSSDVAPVGTSKKSLRMVSNGSCSVGYAVVHGPYAVNNTAVDVVAGDIVEFWWKAAGGSDAYDIFAYLLNTSTGATITLLNDTGTSSGATTPWTRVSRTVNTGEDGNYKFVFVSGTFDYTGGKILGASLYVDEVNIIKAQPIANTSGLSTKYLKFTGPGQWPWTPNRGVLE